LSEACSIANEIWIEVEEIKRPDLDAKLMAEGIAKQLERRVPFRRVLKKSMQASMDAGAAGIKVKISGRIGGAEIARTEWYKEGRIPLQTLRAEIDYSMGRAETTYGSIGVKVWINRGEETLSRPAGN
jgi:small subunit ribosomal protein S3